MDFETFKEELREDMEKALYERTGTEHSVNLQTVEKMNETYEALTIKPENSDIGVNINANELFRAYSDGMDYDRLVDGAVNKARDALENSPNFNIEAFKDYDKMKDTFVAVYELIQIIMSYNNLASFETWFIYKWVFKTFVAVELITHTFDFTMAVFDVAQHVILNAGGVIAGSVAVDASGLAAVESSLEDICHRLALLPC